MKKLIMMLVAAGAALCGWSDDEISLVETEMTQVTVPFGIKSYMPSNKDVVRIEKTSDSALRLTALKVGRCDLEVSGDNDLRQKFQITVRPPLAYELKNLQRELERVPEVHCTIVGDTIRIDGEVKSIKKWNYMMKVIKGYGKVRNFAEFTPGPEILLRMKESLQQSGFDVVFERHAGEPESWKANCVALEYSKVNRTMTVQAKVYTPEQQAMIMACLKSEKRWLVVDQSDKEAFDDEIQIKGNIQVVVAKPIVRVSVAYMAIGESDLKKIGNPNANNSDGDGVLNMSGVFNTLYSLIPGGSDSSGARIGRHGNNTAQVGASLNVFTRFLAQNGISRISDTGYTLIESWAKDGAKFKSGGTRFVRVYGRDVAELKEIPYGFSIDAKGGMVDDSSMSLDFNFELSTIIPMDDGTFDRKEDISKQKISCQIGRTTLVSGFMDMVDKRTPPSGLPFLRSTPMLNWFVADSGKEVTDRRLVIMICPEIVDSTQDAKPDVNKEINIRVQDQAAKDTEQVEKERKAEKGFSGFWSWLNWFTF
jgi:hypothetical protein